MGIDNIRHPIKDTVKADNSTYSSNKIESLIHSATELPETSIEDAGDVLMVNEEGEWDKGEIIIPQELPTVTSEDAGDVLMVNDDGEWTNAEIPAPEPELPSGNTYDYLRYIDDAWVSSEVIFQLSAASMVGYINSITDTSNHEYTGKELWNLYGSSSANRLKPFPDIYVLTMDGSTPVIEIYKLYKTTPTNATTANMIFVCVIPGTTSMTIKSFVVDGSSSSGIRHVPITEKIITYDT